MVKVFQKFYETGMFEKSFNAKFISHYKKARGRSYKRFHTLLISMGDINKTVVKAWQIG